MTEKNKSKLPIVDCVICGGKCYPIDVVCACDKCASIFDVDASIVADSLELIPTHKRRIKDYLKSLINKKKIYDQFAKDAKSDIQTLDNTPAGFTVSFKGDMLAVVHDLKKKYNFKNFSETIIFIVHGFLFVLKAIKSMPGNEIYFIDEHGNKSKEISKSILAQAYDAINKEKDREHVERFANDMGIIFQVEAIKKHGDK